MLLCFEQLESSFTSLAAPELLLMQIASLLLLPFAHDPISPYGLSVGGQYTQAHSISRLSDRSYLQLLSDVTFESG